MAMHHTKITQRISPTKLPRRGIQAAAAAVTLLFLQLKLGGKVSGDSPPLRITIFAAERCIVFRNDVPLLPDLAQCGIDHICAGVIAAGEVPLDFQRYRVGNIGTLIAQHFLHIGIPLG